MNEIPIDATTRTWWEFTRHRLLALQTCQDCGIQQHRPRSICTSCGSLTLGWRTSTGVGTVLSATTVHRSPDPDRAAGYVVALVQLTEGPTMLTNLVGDDPGEIAIGATVELDWRPMPDGRNLPIFRRRRTADVGAFVPDYPLRVTEVQQPLPDDIRAYVELAAEATIRDVGTPT